LLTDATQRTKALLALWLAVAIWASTFVVSQDTLTQVGPAVLTTARFAVAAVILVAASLLRGASLGDLLGKAPAFCGITGVALYYGLQNIGLMTTGAGTAALLQAALPIATAGLAIGWLGERLSGRELVGVALSVLGIMLIVGVGIPEPGMGELAILSGVVAYAVYTAYLHRYSADVDPLDLATGSALYGLVLLTPWALWELINDGTPQFSVGLLGAIGYLGALGSASTLLLWTAGVRRVSATTAGAFTGAIPALGYLFALATGEPLSWVKLGGGFTSLLGIALASTTNRARHRHDPTPAATTNPLVAGEDGGG